MVQYRVRSGDKIISSILYIVLLLNLESKWKVRLDPCNGSEKTSSDVIRVRDQFAVRLQGIKHFNN